jgi:hypothetical protein
MEEDLKQIQKAIKEIDNQRMAEGLTKEEVEILEMSAVAMRDYERLVIAKLQKKVIKDIETKTAGINALAKKIRAKVTKMNALPKSIDKIEGTIKIIYQILHRFEKWI